MGAGHAHVGDVRGAAGQHAFIGGGHMRVRADHGGDAAIEIPAHGNFFTRCFRMKIHNDNFHI